MTKREGVVEVDPRDVGRFSAHWATGSSASLFFENPGVNTLPFPEKNNQRSKVDRIINFRYGPKFSRSYYLKYAYL
jgi:hypothetical protein